MKQVFQKLLQWLRILGEVWPGIVVLSTIISITYVKFIAKPTVVIQVSKRTEEFYNQMNKCNLEYITPNIGKKIKVIDLDQGQILKIWLELGQIGCDYYNIKKLLTGIEPALLKSTEDMLLNQFADKFYEESKGLNWLSDKNDYAKVHEIIHSLYSIFPIEYGRFESRLGFEGNHFMGDCKNPTDQQILLVTKIDNYGDDKKNIEYSKINKTLEDYLNVIGMKPVNVSKYDTACNNELCSVIIANKNGLGKIAVVDISINAQEQVNWYIGIFNNRGEILDVTSSDRDFSLSPFKIMELGNSIKKQISCIKNY